MSGAILLPVLKQRFFDSNGEPLAGGLVYSYVAGTQTPAATFTDASGLEANQNPITLDSDGYAAIWLGSGSYKFVVNDENDVTQFTTDNVSVDGSGATGLSTPWISSAITDGQAATAISGVTIDLTKYTACVFDVQITRGSPQTVISNGQIAVQNLNGVARVSIGSFMAHEAHGVLFTVTQTGMLAQLCAQATSGVGNGVIKLRPNPISI